MGSIPGPGRSSGEGNGKPPQYSCLRFGKPCSGHRISKGPFSFQPQRRTMPKNVQTIIQLCSFHILVSLCSKLQDSFQQYMNQEVPDVQTGFRRGRGTRGLIANIYWIMKKEKEFQTRIYFCFIEYMKAFDGVDHNKLWEILNEIGVPDHLTYLLRNLYADQEAIVRTRHGTTDWFQTGKGVWQGCIFSPCLLKLYAEYIMWNAELDES